MSVLTHLPFWYQSDMFSAFPTYLCSCALPLSFISYYIYYSNSRPVLIPFRLCLHLLILDSSLFPTLIFHISLFTEYHTVLPSSINTPVRLRSMAFRLLYSLRYAPTPPIRPITPPSLDLSLPTCPNGFRHLQLLPPKLGPIGTTRAQHQSWSQDRLTP